MKHRGAVTVRPLPTHHTMNPNPLGEPRCFRIIRFYSPTQNRRARTIKTRLTETEAQTHCSRPDTRRPGVYFDGYDYMKGHKP